MRQEGSQVSCRFIGGQRNQYLPGIVKETRNTPHMKSYFRLTAVLLSLTAISLLFTPTSVAQTAPDPAAPSQAKTPSSDRLIVKGLRLMQPAEPSRLTERMRFNGYLQNTLGPIPFATAFVGSGFSQLLDSPTEWHQGASGYGKRVVNSLGYNAVQQTIAYGVSYAFKEDNRYFASGKKGFWPRTLYAATSPVMASHVDGHRSVSISSVSGIVGASFLSRTWSPSSWQGADNVAVTIVLTCAYTAGFNFTREFVPDLIRHFQKK